MTARTSRLCCLLALWGAPACGEHPSSKSPADGRDAESEASHAQPFGVLTLNVRTSLVDPISPFEQTWAARLPRVLGVVQDVGADILSTQEVMDDQRADLDAALPEFQRFGEGRLPGGTNEAVSLYLRRDRVTLVGGDTFWLSESPEEPGSLGWDALFPRICTWVEVEIDGASLFVFNVHLDNEGVIARREGAALVLARIEAIAGDSPVVLTGDFNATPDSEPIVAISSTLVDALVAARPELSEAGTMHAYQPTATARIDYVFASSELRALDAGIVSTGPDADGRYASDHHGVRTTFRLER